MPEMLALRDTDPREVGVYQLLGRLGEGGQGVVFLAKGPTGSRQPSSFCRQLQTRRYGAAF